MHLEIGLFFKAQIELPIFRHITYYGLPLFIPLYLRHACSFFKVSFLTFEITL